MMKTPLATALALVALVSLSLPSFAQHKMGSKSGGDHKMAMSGKMHCDECAKLTKKNGKMTMCPMHMKTAMKSKHKGMSKQGHAKPKM